MPCHTVIISCLIQGQWAVTEEQEAEEKRRIQEFQDTIPKMCSQLRILTHFYQVAARFTSQTGHARGFTAARPSHDSLCFFQSIVQQFLVLLMTSSDESLRFLSFRLDFNEHYRFVFQSAGQHRSWNNRIEHLPEQSLRNNLIILLCVLSQTRLFIRMFSMALLGSKS